ncbi:nineteen complex-related protein 2-domain-containing protein [Mycena floridula]|nr:nineteen complex-related protein 2-domain-containing protein [Mycena floridula]
MFKQRTKKGALRARDSSASPPPENDSTMETGTETDQPQGSESPLTLASKLKAKSKSKSKAKARLSFGGDDEEAESSIDVFKLKKSNLSQKVTLRAESVPTSLDQANISQSSPRYDAASLKELRAGTISRPTPVADASVSYDGDVSMSYDADVSLSVDPDDVGELQIPSSSSILSAKEQRKRLQAQPESQDFISLTVATRSDDQGPHPESRLIREEDELGEGDDEYAEYTSAQERIALGKKSMKAEKAKRRDAMKEMIEEGEDPDEIASEWEMEQLRRGGHRTPELSTPKPLPYKAALIPATTPVPTLGPALSRLGLELTRITSSHASSTAALAGIGQERNELETRESELREMVEKAEIKRAWFKDFTSWVEGVAEFLDEKYPILESLESEFIALLRERREMLDKTRRTDVQEEIAMSPTDAAAYAEAIASLASRKKEVLSDVKAPEFLDPAKGKWWGTWRTKYNDTYTGAWGGLGVVSMWEFWARLEILGWDCIRDSQPLDSFHWYKGIFEYDEQGESLVAALLSTAVVPRLVKVVEEGLDVYLEVEVKKVVELVEEVEAGMNENSSGGNAKLQMLMKAVHTAFERAVVESVALAKKYPSPALTPKSFLDRELTLFRNLLRWRKFSRGLFGIDVLVQRLVGECVLPAGGLVVQREVISLLPPELVTDSVKRMVQ